jgi:hypothetical protein
MACPERAHTFATVPARFDAYGNHDEDPIAMLESYVELHAAQLRKLTLDALRSARAANHR